MDDDDVMHVEIPIIHDKVNIMGEMNDKKRIDRANTECHLHT